jgi:chromosomal replication initiator protein
MNGPPPLWSGVIRQLQSELSEFAIEAWIRPLAAREDDERLRILAPSPFHKKRVEACFLTRIREIAASQADHPIDVAVELLSQERDRLPRQHRARRTAAVRPPQAKVNSRPRQPVLSHSFENFVVGPTNALAREASLALAQGRQNGVSPLFLMGPPGNGKSHLAEAVITEARRNGIERGRHTSAEAFTTQLLSSIRSKQTGGFKRRFREQTDLLVVEDVQFFQGKTATQLELFHTLEHLIGVGARIVLTGDRLPRDIPKLDRRLSSQMSSGLVVEVELPDAELRRRVLLTKASAGGVRLPECCLNRLVEAVRGSVRDLEGALIQLVATASLLKKPIDLELTEAALRKVADPGSQSGALGVEVVIGTVADFFGVSIEALSSRSRKRSILVPRQLAMFLSRRYTDASLTEIGRALGRDHPAVRNAIQVVERAILERAPLRYQVEELASRIEKRRSQIR